MTPRKDPKVIAAEKLWRDLKKSLVNAERTIINIIRSKAWEPLGFDSFEKAWVELMADTTLANEIRPHVAYTLFDENVSPERVADICKGIGPKTAKSLKRQRDNGVPAEHATTVVRSHERKIPYEADSHIRIEFPPAILATYRALAARIGKTVNEIAHDAIVAEFDQLQRLTR